MYGSAMGTLQVDTFDGSLWSTQWSLTGDQGEGWSSATIEVRSEEVVRVRFVGTTGSSYTSDMALDDVVIYSLATATPTITLIPTVSPAPSPLTTPAPSLAPTVQTLIFSAPIIVRTYTQLERAIRLAASNSTALVIDLLADISMISELNIESEVTIRSPVGAVLSGGGSTQLIYVEAAGTLVVENTTLRKGYASVRVL